MKVKMILHQLIKANKWMWLNYFNRQITLRNNIKNKKNKKIINKIKRIECKCTNLSNIQINN